MKKIIISFIWLCFILNLSSCYSTRTLTGESQVAKFNVREDVKIIKLITKSGDVFVFNRDEPGQIVNENVVGWPEERINYNQVDSVIQGQNNMPEFLISAGIRYKIITFDRSTYLCMSLNSINVSLKDVAQLQVIKINEVGLGIVFLIVAGSLAFLAGSLLIFVL